MTPYDIALRLIRQRGTTTCHPEFIAAYLRAEAERERKVTR